MPPITLCCPECEAVLKVANRPTTGKKVKCPKCEAPFIGTDHIVAETSTAVKSKPDRAAAASSKKRPTRDDDEEDNAPRRRSKGKRDPDYDEEAAPRRSKVKKSGSNLGLIIGLVAGGGALLLGLVVVAGGLFWWLAGKPNQQIAKAAPELKMIAVKNEAPPAIAPAGKPNQAVPAPQPPANNKQPVNPKKKKDKLKPPAPMQEPAPPPEPVPVAVPVDLDKTLLAKTTQATVYIRTDLGNQTATGSGFLVKSSGDTGYIITNLHVISLNDDAPQQANNPPAGKKKGPKGPPNFPRKGPGMMGRSPFGPKQQPKVRPRITVVLHSGTPMEQSVSAEVVAVDPEVDLAALRITGARNLPAALDLSQEAAVAETQPVYTFGFPANKARPGPGSPTITVGKGSISGLRRNLNNDLVDIHINGELNPGNSGGPVIDAQGRLVGVAVATVLGKQIGFVIPAGELTQMFKGRLSTGILYHLEQKGTIIGIKAETWLYDRKSNVRAREALALRIPDQPQGQNFPPNEYGVVVRLADPMLKINTVQGFFTKTTEAAAKADAQGWSPMANALPVSLKIQDQVAQGVFRLPPGAVADDTFAFQFSYVNADGQTIFTQPHLVRLTFPKNPQSVTLNVVGIPDEPTMRYIEDTAPSLFVGKISIKQKKIDSLVIEIDPVPDPKVIADQIKFGAVTNVQGRTFTVTTKKIELPQPQAAAVTTALEDLKSTDNRRRIAAADQLAKAYAPLLERRAEVAKALETQALDKDIWVAKAALRALLVWGGPENLTAVTAALGNNFTHGEALHVLARFKNATVAAVFAKLLPSLGDRAFVSANLKAMGPMAEKEVIPFAKHKDVFTAKEACSILKEIGTAECLPALMEVVNQNNGFVSPGAREAIQTVQARLKGAAAP